MFSEDYESFFKQVIFRSIGTEVAELNFTFLAGGCINDTVKLSCAEGDFFLKWNDNVPEDMFAKEAAGLQLLFNSQTIRVPRVINQDHIDGKQFLLLEYLEPGRRQNTYWETLGQQLAALHKCQQDTFGLDHDNYIGRLPQKNERCKSWSEFFIECRLKPQVGLAKYNHLLPEKLYRQFDDFYRKVPGLFSDEPPSLLHGDLWSGNVHTSSEGFACIIDPAVYYGHREMDLAFTKLFGGFDPAFYYSYDETFPLSEGWEGRTELFNLYPLLVHVNLFGLSYLPAVERIVKRYI